MEHFPNKAQCLLTYTNIDCISFSSKVVQNFFNLADVKKCVSFNSLFSTLFRRLLTYRLTLAVILYRFLRK